MSGLINWNPMDSTFEDLKDEIIAPAVKVDLAVAVVAMDAIVVFIEAIWALYIYIYFLI